jgi:hypothetical protein
LACVSSERAPRAVISAEPPRDPPEVVADRAVPNASTPPAVTEPEPDFRSFDELRQGAADAIGKRGRLRLRRDHFTSSDAFTGVSCGDDRGFLRLEFAPELRDQVRAMHGAAQQDCATVLFTVTAVDKRGPFFDAKVEKISDVTPKGPVPGADGADYGSIDDVLLAGAEAKGKLVEASVWVYDGDPQLLRVHDCGRVDVDVFVISKTKAQKALAKRLSTDPARCAPARLRIVEAVYTSSASDGSVSRPRAEIVRVR